LSAVVGDALLKCACVAELSKRKAATAETVSLISAEALSNRLMSDLADLLLMPIAFSMDGASEHSRATRVEAAVAAVAARGARGRRAVADVVHFLIAVASHECVNPKGRCLELRGCVSTIPDARGAFDM